MDLRPLGPHQLTHEAGDSEVSSHVFLDAFADDARERAAVVGDALRFVAAVHVDAARLLPPAPTRTASAISLDLDSHDGAAVEALPRPVLALHARVEVRRPTARGSATTCTARRAPLATSEPAERVPQSRVAD